MDKKDTKSGKTKELVDIKFVDLFSLNDGKGQFCHLFWRNY